MTVMYFFFWSWRSWMLQCCKSRSGLPRWAKCFRKNMCQNESWRPSSKKSDITWETIKEGTSVLESTPGTGCRLSCEPQVLNSERISSGGRKIQKTAEVLQVQHYDKIVNVPLLMQRQNATIHRVQKTVEVPQI